MAFEPGQVIEGKYRIVRLLGEGGMGAVYEGENTAIARRVAIKILHGEASRNEDAVRRFEREAQAAGRIGSDHIVDVLDLGTLPAGERFLVMEYLDGESLHDRIVKQGRLPAQAIAPIALQLLDGLAAAHDAGIIHRDLKPENVFLVRGKGGGDLVKLLDFGISKFAALSGDAGFSMTRTGSVMGTPFYMSPEQARGEKAIDVRVDVYAIGVILFEALTGQVPFSGDNFNELLFKIVLGAPPDLATLAPETPPGLVAIVKKAMARDAAERFPTARDLAVAIDAWMAGAGVLPTTLMGSNSAARRLAGAAVGAASQRPKTPSAWGNEPPAIPRKSGAPRVGVALAVAAVALGLGVAAWVGTRSTPAEVAAPTTASTAVALVAPPAALPAALPAATAEPPASASAVPAVLASAAPVVADPPKKATPAAAAAGPAKPAPKATATAPASPAATAGGRRIRTEL